jgi:hypothetical protein
MKKCLLCFTGVLLNYAPLFSQFYFYDANHLEPEWRIEAGISLGIMNCLTDLGGHKGTGKKFVKDINWNSTKPCGGLFLAVTHHDHLGIRVESTWGALSGADSLLKNDPSEANLRYKRNLHFRSKIREFGALLEFHPLYLARSGGSPLSPYLLLGIGYFHFQPEALFNGSWVSLQPLHTEGEGFREFPDRQEYKLQQINFLLGLGFKYDVSRRLVIRLEILYRILTTDYLDDVSQGYIDPSLFHKYLPPSTAELALHMADRGGELDPLYQTIPGSIRGNPKNKDGYFSLNVKISMVLNRKRF